MASGTSGGGGTGNGFQDGMVYQIRSMKDKKGVMDVEKYDTNPQASLITYKKYLGGPNQKFIVRVRDGGSFRVSSLHQSAAPNSTEQVWDFVPSQGLLMQNDASAADSQLWDAEEIFPNSKICIIKSKFNGECLKNMGSGHQIKLVAVPVNKKDKAILWQLVPTSGLPT